jgi:BON domain-containing protein
MRKVVFLALLAAVLPVVSASAESPAEKQMAQRIGSQIKQSGQLQNYRIGVKFNDGVAYLEGTVTSQEQRNAAVRLAQKVNGVSRVVSKLEIQSKPEASSRQVAQSNNEAPADTKPAHESNRYQLAAALEQETKNASERERSRVMQAYQQSNENVPAPRRQMQMMQGNRAPMNGMMMQRNNMPMPSRQMPRMMPVRQAGASGVYQAGGACPNCNGGPAMGGPCAGDGSMGPAPVGFVPQGAGRGPSYDNASMPGYAWPSYASYPNYAALSYPQQYSPTAWPYIGPFYPYPQVPLAWRKVSLEWDDGWWFLDFSSHNSSH